MSKKVATKRLADGTELIIKFNDSKYNFDTEYNAVEFVADSVAELVEKVEAQRIADEKRPPTPWILVNSDSYDERVRLVVTYEPWAASPTAESPRGREAIIENGEVKPIGPIERIRASYKGRVLPYSAALWTKAVALIERHVALIKRHNEETQAIHQDYTALGKPAVKSDE